MAHPRLFWWWRQVNWVRKISYIDTSPHANDSGESSKRHENFQQHAFHVLVQVKNSLSLWHKRSMCQEVVAVISGSVLAEQWRAPNVTLGRYLIGQSAWDLQPLWSRQVRPDIARTRFAVTYVLRMRAVELFSPLWLVTAPCHDVNPVDSLSKREGVHPVFLGGLAAYSTHHFVNH